jgi:hypothetical protein
MSDLIMGTDCRLHHRCAFKRSSGYFNNPTGDQQAFTAPNAIWGPKVMIINEMAGSGGDMLPYMFKMRKIGPTMSQEPGRTCWNLGCSKSY